MIKVQTFPSKKALQVELYNHGVKTGILSVGSDSKTIKGVKYGYHTGVLYMHPNYKICPASKAAACDVSCLNTAGRARFLPAIGIARQAKTDLFQTKPELFFAALIDEISRNVKKYKDEFVVRLNGTSDIAYEDIILDTENGVGTIFDLFPTVQFYDYTKRLNRVVKKLPSNYDLTLSWSGARASYAESVMYYANKYNKRVAVVFENKNFPEYFHGRKVVNGDETDLRFLDDHNVVIGLSAKGKAKQDATGFVYRSTKLIAVA